MSPEFVQAIMGAMQQREAGQTFDKLKREIPEFQDYDLGQYADFPELQKMMAAEKVNSAYTEGGGEGFDARLKALGKLEGISDTGESATAAAERARMNDDSGMRDKAARESILAREQEMSGGNNTGRRMQDQLLAAQSGADRRAMGDLGVQANLENSKIAALQG
jgi:hypothetical protein